MFVIVHRCLVYRGLYTFLSHRADDGVGGDSLHDEKAMTVHLNSLEPLSHAYPMQSRASVELLHGRVIGLLVCRHVRALHVFV